MQLFTQSIGQTIIIGTDSITLSGLNSTSARFTIENDHDRFDFFLNVGETANLNDGASLRLLRNHARYARVAASIGEPDTQCTAHTRPERKVIHMTPRLRLVESAPAC